MKRPRFSRRLEPQLNISDYFTLLEWEAGHVVVSLILIALGTALWMRKML
jgi:hypothetical protein